MSGDRREPFTDQNRMHADYRLLCRIQNQDFYIFTHKGYKRQLEDISADYLQAFDQAMFQ